MVYIKEVLNKMLKVLKDVNFEKGIIKNSFAENKKIKFPKDNFNLEK